MSDQKKPHRWVKGQPSANPAGRPRTGLALAEKVRELAGPTELVEFLLSVLRGEPFVRDVAFLKEQSRRRREGLELLDPYDPRNGTTGEVVFPSTAERLSAFVHLRDTGFFKPGDLAALYSATTTHAIPTTDFSKLTAEELDRYIELHEKAAVPALPSGRVVDVV